MTQSQISLIAKWRGVICGPRVVFPTDWHKRMYHREAAGNTSTYKKRAKCINNFFKESANA